MSIYQELVDFTKTIDGLTVKLDKYNDIVISYIKDNKETFVHHYLYKHDFPKKTADDIKEELTTAIAIVKSPSCYYRLWHGLYYYINAKQIDIKRIYRPDKTNDLLEITITERN